MIHKSSIQTIFTEHSIDKLYFGGSIKTYIIPCKYNQYDPFISSNGEYWILFYIPPANATKYHHTQQGINHYHNKNFTDFIQKFDPDYTNDIVDNNTVFSHHFFIFKITASNELTFISSIKKPLTTGASNNEKNLCLSLTLSLYTTDQLFLDAHNNVVGIKQPSVNINETINFDNADFQIKFGSDDDFYMKNVNKITPYYSLGGYYLPEKSGNYISVKQNASLDTGCNASDAFVDEYKKYRGLPIYYTNDNIVFNLKKTYPNVNILAIVPNPNNLKVLCVFYIHMGLVYVDIYDNDTVTTKEINNSIQTIEQINKDEFQVSVHSHIYTVTIYTANFNWDTYEFYNLKTKNTLNIGSNQTPNFTGMFTYNNLIFSEENLYTRSLNNLSHDEQNLSDIKYQFLYNSIRYIYQDKTLIDKTRSRESVVSSCINTTSNNNELLHQSGNIYNHNTSNLEAGIRNNNMLLKNICPLFYELGNYVIFPNQNIILPNSDDIINTKIIKNDLNHEKTFIYTHDSNVHLVKIKDVAGNLKGISGNIIKVSNVDANTEIYAFTNILILETDTNNTIDIDHLGIVNSYITYDNVTNNTDNKQFIHKVDSIFNSKYVSTFYLKQNDIIDFITNGKFIKLTGDNKLQLLFNGNMINNINTLFTDPYLFLKNELKSNEIDLNSLSNNNNTYIPYIVTTQKTIDKTLTAIVVDNGQPYELCKFPYKKINGYENLQPVLANNSYIIDHFVDDDDNVYSKDSVDYTIFNINPNTLDVELQIKADENIIKNNFSGKYLSIPYSVENIADCISSYSNFTSNIVLNTKSDNDITNITKSTPDSTTIVLTGSDNQDHTYELTLNENINNSTSINIGLTTQTIDKNIGTDNIFDNVLNNDGLSISIECTPENNVNKYYTLYYDYISKDIDIWQDDTNSIKYDIEQYGHYSIKTLYFIYLNATNDLKLLNFSENACKKNTKYSIKYDSNEYQKNIDLNFLNDSSSYQKIQPNYNYSSSVLMENVNKYQKNIQRLHQDPTLSCVNEESFFNKASQAVTWLSSYDLNYMLSQKHVLFTYNDKLRTSKKLLSLLQTYDSLQFGILETNGNYTSDYYKYLEFGNDHKKKYQYLGIGQDSYKFSKHKFYGIKLDNIPNLSLNSTFNASTTPISLILNNAKTGKDKMKLHINNVDMTQHIVEVDTTSNYSDSYSNVTDIVGKYYSGLNGIHKNYACYYNYELNNTELSYINNNSNKQIIAKKIYDNLKKQINSSNNNITTTKLDYSLHDVGRDNLAINFKLHDNSLYVYINEFLYQIIPDVKNLNVTKIRFFGNRQFGNKKITMSKNDDFLNENNPTFC